MKLPEPSSAGLVTPRVYQIIATSKTLRKQLLPEDLTKTPYEVLDYQGVLELHDVEGMRATFQRRQEVRILQNGVSSILDHMWGTGVTLGYYENSAGKIGDSFTDGGRRHIVVKLKRAMRKGERLGFDVSRLAMACFLGKEEWLETAIDHPVNQLGQVIIFPRDRPCQRAALQLGSDIFKLPVVRSGDGRTLLRFQVPKPGKYPALLVRWRW